MVNWLFSAFLFIQMQEKEVRNVIGATIIVVHVNNNFILFKKKKKDVIKGSIRN